MLRFSLALCLTVCMAGLGVPASADTYYVETDDSSVDTTLDLSFSTSGYLKLVLFDPNGILDFLNPKANATAGIYANKTMPGPISGTLDASVAGDELTLSAMDLDLLVGGPETVQAGAQIHADEIPFLADILDGLLDNWLDWIDPNVFDPNIITDLLAEMTGGMDFEWEFELTVNSLTMVQTGDPVSVTMSEGAFEDLNPWADIEAEIQFNDSNAISLPAVPLPFWLDGTWTDTPVGTLTMTATDAEGGVETPEVVIIDQLIDLPIGESGLNATFQIHLQIDAGTASYQVAPALTAVTGYLLTVDIDPAGTGTVVTDPVGPEFAPGTTVELTASPSEGWLFGHWEGALSGSANPTTITMDDHKSVTAVFAEEMVALTVLTEGEGSVVLDPPGGNYDLGSTVILAPSPDVGWKFDGWEGDISSTQIHDNPLSLVMDGPKTVTAVFKEDTSICGSGVVAPMAVALLACSLVAIRRRR